MKKNISLSMTTIVMLVLLAVLAVYCFTYLIPTQNELTVLRSEISVHNAQASIYQQYLSDTAPLEADIEAIQAEIDTMNSEGYVNDSTVSLVISDAIQRYNISLSSVSLSSVTTYEEHRALPINLTLSGTMDDILQFIAHFEQNTEGSYLVQATSMEVNGTTTTANLLIYLCTPAI